MSLNSVYIFKIKLHTCQCSISNIFDFGEQLQEKIYRPFEYECVGVSVKFKSKFLFFTDTEGTLRN